LSRIATSLTPKEPPPEKDKTLQENVKENMLHNDNKTFFHI
jgi:hypothetical protein